MEARVSRQATDWREGRRLRAVDLSQKGWKQKDIAEALGVSKGAVSQWLRRAREGGPEALLRKKHPGPRPRLTPEQRAQLPHLLARGPQAFGFRGELWTQPRVATVLRREFGISYHPSQVGRILRDCGWTRQKPMRRASQRDEEAIRRWREERWPEVKKRGQKRGGRSPS